MEFSRTLDGVLLLSYIVQIRLSYDFMYGISPNTLLRVPHIVCTQDLK